ncbi:MAG: ATP-binding cassette domain-containing protein, partial [Acidimicrobiia bacterium]
MTDPSPASLGFDPARPPVPAHPAPPPADRPLRTGGAEALGTAGITVRFGDLMANQEVSLSAAEGQITALIGPNGAGKTTLFNIIAGRIYPTAGHVLFHGEDITWLKPHERSRKGLARTFQI